MEPPRTGIPLPTSSDSAQARQTQQIEGEGMTSMQEPEAGTSPSPAEDENQPGFIGERNRPHPS